MASRALDAGTLTWMTVSQERIRCLTRFDRWLATLDDPVRVLGDPAEAAAQAAAFRRWDTDPANRLLRSNDRRFADRPVGQRQINDDLRAVGELFAFVADNPVEARAQLGAGPWSQTTAAHAASWFRQVDRVKRIREFNDVHTTSTTTPWARSSPRCRCWACPVTGRWRSLVMTEVSSPHQVSMIHKR